jgi:hypothetical protein
MFTYSQKLFTYISLDTATQESEPMLPKTASAASVSTPATACAASSSQMSAVRRAYLPFLISAVERTMATASAKAIRYPFAGHAIPSPNAALVIADFSLFQLAFIAAMDRRTVAANVIAIARSATLYGLPILGLSVNVIHVIQLIRFFLQ